ncbi:MAG TPA: hypothetical protein VF075_10655 [Pyrinomonadaceae bacterium]
MKAILIVAAVLLLGVVATKSQFAGANAKLEDGVNAIPPLDLSQLAQSDEAGPEMKLVLLGITPQGFDSNEMHLDAGEYVFIVGNRTGLKEINVRLEREGKERVSAATLRRRGNWKQRLKLTPGTYLVSADDNPDWICRIVVGP